MRYFANIFRALFPIFYPDNGPAYQDEVFDELVQAIATAHVAKVGLHLVDTKVAKDCVQFAKDVDYARRNRFR